MRNGAAVLAAIVLAAVALGVSAMALRHASARGAERVALLQRLGGLQLEREQLQVDLGRQPGSIPGRDPLQTYLELIRTDGAAAHLSMRRALSRVAANQISLLAVADAYEPLAAGAGYSAALRELRTHVLAWNARWESLFEVFMAGGNLPDEQMPFPESFRVALRAEGAPGK